MAPILACCGLIVWHSLLNVTDDAVPAHASATLNIFVFYTICVAIYLSVNRGKEWKILTICSLIVIGFIGKLMLRN